MALRNAPAVMICRARDALPDELDDASAAGFADVLDTPEFGGVDFAAALPADGFDDDVAVPVPATVIGGGTLARH